MSVTILAIESSCDDTSAAIVRDGILLSNVIAGQEDHNFFGGVVPELASRSHLQNIVPVVDTALKNAKLTPKDISAIAFTIGPGLIGSLLVGVSFAKGFAIANNIPLIEVNHLMGHIFTAFVKEKYTDYIPEFPFLSMTISGGHTQIALVNSFDNISILGKTIDDAAGEAFDKCAKVMNLGYPGGPIIDEISKNADSNAFVFAKPKIKGLDFSFSGLKTSFLYLIRDNMLQNPNFIEQNKANLAASLQKTIVEVLLEKILLAIKQTKVKTVVIGGGVAANSLLRSVFETEITNAGVKLFLPKKKFTTDNAAMIATVAYFKYLQNQFCNLSVVPFARV